MFTGIIKDVGQISRFYKFKNGYNLNITTTLNFTNKEIGNSVSCSGVCLTLIKIINKNKKREICFFLSNHTYKTSAFIKFKIGNIINLEKSLKLGDEIGGHIVQGHVDTTLKVISILNYKSTSWEIFFNVPKKFKKFLIERGSISINGISLTIAKILKNKFKVVIIPHTLKNTNLLDLKTNDYVNVEFDLITKTLLNK